MSSNMTVARVKPESSKVAKQNVPAFLNKLASMVSDPDTDDLVRWSEDGESFYVPNHERFGKELLPKFFKHSNFSSFVRQLNMYGFHKVPHLQQGVLKNETENELWQFSNPNFKRDMPDLLPLIARKKGLPQDMEGDAQLLGGAKAPGGLDLRTIANGIATIKRHQNAISSDLKELQTSNRALWQEALAARERHQQHQDTINKILRFLAGVFGNNVPMAGPGASPSGASSKESEAGAVIPGRPRKKARLLLSDGRTQAPGAKRKAPEEGEEEYGDPAYYEPQMDDIPSMSNRFSEVTPSDTTGQDPPSVPPEVTSPQTATEPPQAGAGAPPFPIKRSPSEQSISPGTLSRRQSAAPANAEAGPSRLPSAMFQTPAFAFPNSPATVSAADQANSNAVFASTLQALLNSPNSAQRLLASLALPQGQQQYPTDVPVAAQPQYPLAYPQQQAPVYPYSQNWDFSQAQEPSVAPANISDQQAQPPPNYSSALFPSNSADQASMLQAVAENANGLQRSYKDAETINADVDALQESINSLIQSLGLEPSELRGSAPAANAQTGDAAGPEPSTDAMDTQADGIEPMDAPGVPADFDLEAFLRQLNSGQPNLSGLDQYNAEPGANPATNFDAFFDDISTESTASTPPMFGAEALPEQPQTAATPEEFLRPETAASARSKKQSKRKKGL